MLISKPSSEPSFTPPSRWRDATLLIAGHGSSRIPDSGRATLDLAAAIANRRWFRDVRTGFCKGAPALSDALDGVDTENIYVVPNLACRGHIFDAVLSPALGSIGPVTEIFNNGRRRRLFLCEPVGMNPALPGIVAGRIRETLKTSGVRKTDAVVMIVAHGSSRGAESYLQTRTVAEAVSAIAGIRTRAVFLEQTPRLEDWRALARGRFVLILPFMVATGVHGAIDIPRLVGIDLSDAELSAISRQGYAGPFDIGDKSILYCRAVGSEPGLADVIVDQVRQFDRRNLDN